MRRQSTTARGLLALSALVLAAVTSGCRLAAQPVQIPMRDGKFLAADVYLPASTGHWPTILIQTPYDRSVYQLQLPFQADNYAFVIVDMRGYFGSVGAINPSAKPGQDGYDCVEWIAQQSWSDGKVGTWGPSALGVVQFQTAREHPPHLFAAVPQVAGFITTYGNYFPNGTERKEYVDALSGGVSSLGASTILQHPTRDGWWNAVESGSDYASELDVPMLVVGGWYDHRTDDLVSSYRSLVTKSSAAVRNEHRLLVGPWQHEHVDEDTAGAVTYADAAGIAAADTVAFFDKHLRGVGDGPSGERVKWYDLGNQRWEEATDWPPPQASNHVLYFGTGGALVATPPIESTAATGFSYDPADPSPTVGGANFQEDVMPSGPQDQATVEARGDAITFTSETLASDVTLAGKASVLLYASSDRTDTDFVVRLTDVAPDGTSMLVTDGARKGRFRNGVSQQQLLTPGSVYSFQVDLPATAITFKAGHKIRVIVSSSNYPRYYANRNDGGTLYDANAPFLVAQNTIFHDVSHPSQLVLPTAN